MVIVILNLADTLGLSVVSAPWRGAENLPYFLNETYHLQKVTLDSVSCLFAEPLGEVPTVQAVAKHFSRIYSVADIPVVLQLNGLSGERRKALIEARIPFVATGQIYLPFMGVILQKQLYDEPKARERLMPSAQLLLFSFLYQNSDKMHTGPMAGKLGISAMQITRAVRQLHKLNLIEVFKEGVQIVIRGKTYRRTLFERARPYLLNPVKEIKYVMRGNLPDNLPYAGLNALSEISMLSAPIVTTRACHSKTAWISGENALTDSDNQTRLEIWKYAPALLSIRSDIADPLSVIASLQDERDERVEQAIEEFLNNMWG